MSQRSILIIVSLASVALIAAVLLLIPLIKKAYFRKNLIKIFHKYVYHVALYNDYYLINRMALPIDAERFAHIDHILFGEKYIYVIKDRYYKGALSGKENDESWIYFPDEFGKSRYIDNPLKANRARTEKLSLFTNLDEDLFVAIVLVNNDCLIDKFDGVSQRDYVVQVGKFHKLIEAIEARPVPRINEAQLAQAVQDIAHIKKGDFAR